MAPRRPSQAPQASRASRSRSPRASTAENECSDLSSVDEHQEQFDGDAAVLPPLQEGEILKLVERTAALGLHFPKKIEQFNPEDARLTYNAHLAKWGLDKREPPHARGVQQPRVFVSRPPLESCAWYVDLSDAKLRELLALTHAERAKKLPIHASGEAVVQRQLAARGYTPQPLVYLEDDTALPRPVDTDALGELDDAPGELSAPSRLRLPDKVPSLPSGKPAAPIIVKEFEDYVVVGEEVFSPMRLWSLAARQGHEKLMKQTTLFGRRAQLYLFIVSRELEPEEVPGKESELRKEKHAWMESMTKAETRDVNFARAARPV